MLVNKYVHNELSEFYTYPSLLVCQGCCNGNAIDWMAYKQQRLTSHSSRDWEFQDQISGRFSVYWRSFCASHTVIFSSLHLHMPGGERGLWGLFHKDTNPILECSLVTSQRLHLLIPSHWVLGSQYMNFQGHKNRSLLHYFSLWMFLFSLQSDGNRVRPPGLSLWYS